MRASTSADAIKISLYLAPLMRKTFVSNLILLVALNLLVKPFYLLVVEAEIQNRCGTEAFGSYFALINFSFLLNILLDLGITNWNTRNVARHQASVAHHFHQAFTLRMLLAGLYALVSVIIGLTLHYSTAQMTLLAVLVFNQMLASGILYLRSNLSGLHLFRQDSLLSILDRLILTLLMSWLLWMSGQSTFKTEWLVYGQTAAYAITFVFALVLVLRHTGPFKVEWNRLEIRRILKESWPFASLMFVSVVAYRIDSVMLERMRGADQAGTYAMGFRVFEAGNMISYLFATLLLPIFSGMLHRKEDVRPLLSLSFRLMLVGCVVVAGWSWFWANDLLLLIYDAPGPDAVEAFRWLMIGGASFSLQYIFGTLITAGGQMKMMIRIALAGTILSVFMNLLLIPEYGAQGAAMTNAVVQTLVLLAQIVSVRRHMHIKLGSDPLRATLFVLISAAIGAFISFTPAIKDLGFAYSLAIFTLTTVLAAFAMGMLHAGKFIEIIRTEK